MSNDDVAKDYPERFWHFIEDNPQSHMLIAFCPNFDADAEAVGRRMDALTILTELRKTHDIFFWVIQHSQNPHTEPRRIDDPTIQRLRDFGTVDVFGRRNANAEELANSLRGFVTGSLG